MGDSVQCKKGKVTFIGFSHTSPLRGAPSIHPDRGVLNQLKANIKNVRALAMEESHVCFSKEEWKTIHEEAEFDLPRNHAIGEFMEFALRNKVDFVPCDIVSTLDGRAHMVRYLLHRVPQIAAITMISSIYFPLLLYVILGSLCGDELALKKGNKQLKLAFGRFFRNFEVFTDTLTHRHYQYREMVTAWQLKKLVERYCEKGDGNPHIIYLGEYHHIHPIKRYMRWDVKKLEKKLEKFTGVRWLHKSFHDAALVIPFSEYSDKKLAEIGEYIDEHRGEFTSLDDWEKMLEELDMKKQKKVVERMKKKRKELERFDEIAPDIPIRI